MKNKKKIYYLYNSKNRNKYTKRDKRYSERYNKQTK